MSSLMKFKTAEYDDVEDYKDGNFSTGSIIGDDDDDSLLIEVSHRGSNFEASDEIIDAALEKIKAALA